MYCKLAFCLHFFLNGQASKVLKYEAERKYYCIQKNCVVLGVCFLEEHELLHENLNMIFLNYILKCFKLHLHMITPM